MEKREYRFRVRPVRSEVGQFMLVNAMNIFPYIDVLVLDDDHLFCVWTEETLRLLGFQDVYTACSSAAGACILDHHKPAIVLVNVDRHRSDIWSSLGQTRHRGTPGHRHVLRQGGSISQAWPGCRCVPGQALFEEPVAADHNGPAHGQRWPTRQDRAIWAAGPANLGGSGEGFRPRRGFGLRQLKSKNPAAIVGFAPVTKLSRRILLACLGACLTPRLEAV